MSQFDKRFLPLAILSIGGLLFSGYLSAVKLFSDTCAFGESCPYFLGYPACYFGFAMYLLLSTVFLMLLLRKGEDMPLLLTGMYTSAVGILFAGYFTFKELPTLLSDGFAAYVLGLPTCALGLLFYISIFILTITLLRK